MAPKTDLGSRIQQARRAQGLSLQALAERFSRPITRAALSKYERGEVTPRADVLMELGRVLEVPATYFLEESAPAQVHWVAYRKHARLGKKEVRRIQARGELAAEAFLRLRDLVHPGEPPAFPPRASAGSPEEAEAAADALRSAWGLGSGPVDGLVGRVEDAGALVLGCDGHGDFDGLSGRASRGFPVIVLNANRSTDRMRFNVAHELGHLLLDTEGVSPRDEEQIAHRFAAAFLMPREAVFREVGRKRTAVTHAELEHLKRRYGVSMQAWIRRSKELGIVSEQFYRSWHIDFRSRGWHVHEPAPYPGDERPSRFRLLAVRALSERLVDRNWVKRFCPEALDLAASEPGTLSRVRRLMAQSPAERRSALAASAERAAADYSEDPEVEGDDD